MPMRSVNSIRAGVRSERGLGWKVVNDLCEVLHESLLRESDVIPPHRRKHPARQGVRDRSPTLPNAQARLLRRPVYHWRSRSKKQAARQERVGGPSPLELPINKAASLHAIVSSRSFAGGYHARLR